ncbi:MAG: zinc-dependent alcohol dehydrogenase family protein [Candidatus Methylomirabilales bacterium]
MPKIVCFHTLGEANVLQLEDHPLVEPGKGEVRLKVEALGLNRAEVLFRQGQYLEKPVLPSRLGYEASGVIDAVGEEVTEFKVGDRVSTFPGHSMGQYGVYGESAVVPAGSVARYPVNLSPAEGASIWVQYLTGYFALVDIGNLQPGQHVLITAASSSTGYAAIQLAKMMGAVSIATTRTPAKRQNLIDAGADHVIVTDEEDLASRVMEITKGKGADLIYDPIAGPILQALANAAAIRGTVILYGALALRPTVFPLFTALQKSLRFYAYTLFEFTGSLRFGHSGNPEALLRGTRYIYEGLETGRLKPVIDRTFRLDNIVEAHRYMESNQQNGKIVVTV